METEIRFEDGRAVRLAATGEGLGQDWVWTPAGPGAFDVRMGSRNVRVELLEGPDERGAIRLRVQGVVRDLQVVDGRQLLLEKMGMTLTDEAADSKVEAPMPGKVLSVEVAVGAEVSSGDPLLVLEAMKMENVIRAPRDGVIAAVGPVAGEPVEKGAMLVTYETES